MLFNIFTANHGKLSGVEDFISILKNVIQKRGHQVDLTEELNPKAINIIIDEFTNGYANRMIVDFKSSYPDSILFFVLTEFVEKKWLVSSFNFFGSVIDASVIAILNVYVRLKREDFNKPRFLDWVVAGIYLPLFPLFILLNFRKIIEIGLAGVIHQPVYMLMRKLGLEKMITYADGIVLSHKDINFLELKSPMLGIVYPEIDGLDIKQNLFKDKVLGIEITGSVTPYRHKILRKINFLILRFGLLSHLRQCLSIDFSSSNKDILRFAFSIHPPQTKRWKYSSPTRIFRALQIDHNMPVLTKFFNQHPIEKLCLLFSDSTLLDMVDFYKNPNKAWSFLEPKIKEYNQVAESGNNEIINGMIGLAKQRRSQ